MVLSREHEIKMSPRIGVRPGGYALRADTASGMRTFTFLKNAKVVSREHEIKMSPRIGVTFLWRALEDSNLRPTGS